MSTQRLPIAPGHIITEIPGRGGIIAPGPAPCHRCGTPATTQWQRTATDDEAAQHWAAVEAHIRNQSDIAGHGNATWTANRTDTVVKTVHGCDEHTVDAPHATHEADCGGHGACQCQPPVEQDPIARDISGYAAPITHTKDENGTPVPQWPTP